MKISIVGGLGHIGLPLSCLLQVNGNKVIIIDQNTEIFDDIRKGLPNFHEPGLKTLLKKALAIGLEVTDDMNHISKSEYTIITIGTSSNENDKKNFKKVVNKVIQLSNKNSNIILRSTVDFETCNKILNNKIFIQKKLKLAYCPERIAEGKALQELIKLPQIVGTNNSEDFKKFKQIFDSMGTKSINVSYKEAEFIKLFSNVYRYSEFSLINEFANIANTVNLDFSKILNIASKQYPRLKNIPNPGFVGGPCLPKDTKTFIENFNLQESVISKFMDTNEEFELNIIKKIKKEFKSKKIIFLGITFKPDSDDLRGSVSYTLAKKLIETGYEIYIVEPNITKNSINEEIYNFEEIFNITENVIIGTNHKIFKSFELDNKKVIKIGNK